MADNGVIRAGASAALDAFATATDIPVTMTFMAKGTIPRRHPMSLGAAGLAAHDYVGCGFDHADVVICVGYDIVEYHPHLWHRNPEQKIVHIDFNNPDFVQYAESFGARGFRVESAGQLVPVLQQALDCGTVAVVDCPVDYAENMKLTRQLGELVCPI